MRYQEIIENNDVKGCFIAAKLSAADENILINFCHELEIDPLPKNEYHMTLFKHKNIPLPDNLQSLNFSVEIDNYTTWGFFTLPEKGIRNAVFLRCVGTGALVKYRHEILRSILPGSMLTPSGKIPQKYSDWVPHVSISFDDCELKRQEYDDKIMKIKTLLLSGRIKPPLTTLHFDGLIQTPFNNDYGKRI